MSSQTQRNEGASPETARPKPTLVHSGAPETRQYLRLRIACASIVLVLGAIQAWVTRFGMGPDGVSYLDMGDAYWRGDWHHAINAYWSPLYAWILGVFVNGLHAGPFQENPVVHLANFVIYAAALLCFDYFLRNFIAANRLVTDVRDHAIELGLAEFHWWILGYAVFTSTSLLLLGLFRVCPDLCVAAFVYLAAGLILKIRTGRNAWEAYVLLGLVLGFGYLAKAVMFPLSFVFLAVAMAPNVSVWANLRKQAAALVTFLIVAAPLIVAISLQQGKLTFGESGSWNYALYVDGMRYWETDSSLAHPVRQILATPPVFEFGEPVGGTYPPWYDPTYWHAGFKTGLYVHGLLRNSWDAIRVLFGIFFLFMGSVTVGGLLLGAMSNGGLWKCLQRSARLWAIGVPALAMLAIYTPIHLEGRFVASSVAILLLVAYSGIRAKSPAASLWMRRAVLTISVLAFAMVVIAPMVRWRVSNLVYAYPHPTPSSREASAADALVRSGLRPNDRIGLIWSEKWAHGAVRGSFVARLADLKVVTEEIDADAFWNFDEASRRNAIAAMLSVGVRGILAKGVPDAFQTGWQRLGDTEYFLYPAPANP